MTIIVYLLRDVQNVTMIVYLLRDVLNVTIIVYLLRDVLNVTIIVYLLRDVLNVTIIVYLLRDVPDVTGGIQPHQSVVDGHFVEGCSLFVSKKSVRNPDVTEVCLPQPDFFQLIPEGPIYESRISPPLAEIHADRVILDQNMKTIHFDCLAHIEIARWETMEKIKKKRKRTLF